MDPRAATVTVAQLDAIKDAGRRRMTTLPFPFVAFGLANAGGGVACALLGRYHLAPYAFTAFGLAVALSAHAVRRRARDEGVQVSIWPWGLTAAALCFAGVATSHGGDVLNIEILSAIGPFLAQATWLWLLGRWGRSELLIAMSIVMILGCAVIGSITSGDVAVALQFEWFGALMLAAAHRLTPTLLP